MSARTKNKKPRSLSALLALGGGLVIALTAFLPVVSEGLLSIDRGLGDDVLFKSGPIPRNDLVFLGIDEDSLTLQGLDPDLISNNETLSLMSPRFPWDRRVYANAIDKLLTAGARLVVLDLVLAEKSDPEADQALADVIGRYSDRIILASAFAPLSVDGDGFMLVEPYSKFLEVQPPPKYGFVNFRPHPRDGLIREIHYSRTLSQENDQPPISGESSYNSLAGAVLETLGKSYGKPGYEPRFSVKNDKTKATEIYRPISIRSIFLNDDWERRYSSGNFFKNKIIIIGPASARFQDTHQTPVGQLMGPQLHLQAIASGIRQTFVTRPNSEWRGSIFWSAMIGTIAAAALIYLVNRPIITLACGGIAIALAYLAAFAIAHWFSTWIGPTPFALSFALGTVSGQTFDLIRERLERSRLHHQ
ncbi:MAG: CHASE2 domain-containing protein, partial [Armatimonadetes bacterium]|nr:CHASE2 domain-containing protein [Akkermansiaceae bacterium]